ncbi:LPXTG cell wall anchor domain-containing protein [Streptomyces parvulus]|uniref:LPXTG cell wall anchor domain-containing protein n=1 Tax=Streptomyces parvulus TaxID=146923 RepID=UPI0036A654D8
MRPSSQHSPWVRAAVAGVAAAGLAAGGLAGGAHAAEGQAPLPVTLTGPDKVDLALDGDESEPGEPQIRLGLTGPGEYDPDRDDTGGTTGGTGETGGSDSSGGTGTSGGSGSAGGGTGDSATGGSGASGTSGGQSPQGDDGGLLASTGSQALFASAAGVLALALGGVLFVVARRRRTAGAA